MRVLVVNGFDAGEPGPLIETIEARLDEGGHTIDRCDLATDGFDEFMSDVERSAYLTDRPLVTPAPIAGAEAVGAAEGLVVCYPIVHGTAPPRVKSWQERVFVLGVGFEFTPKGTITGALDHLRRALVIGERGPRSGPGRHDRRNDFGPCLARSFHLSSNRRCRAAYRTVGGDGSDRMAGLAALERW